MKHHRYNFASVIILAVAIAIILAVLALDFLIKVMIYALILVPIVILVLRLCHSIRSHKAKDRNNSGLD